MDNFTANTYNAPTPLPKKKFFGINFTPKIIFIILGIVVLIEIIIAVKNLTAPVATPVTLVGNTNRSIPKVATISLTTAKTAYKIGEIIPVSVTVDTAGRLIDGVDFILQYDPKILEVKDQDIIKGTLFDDYPLAAVDSSRGLVTMSGISNAQNGILVSGQFVTINFKAKARGKTALTIDFQKDTTIHSNLVEASTLSNVLGQVNNLEINIQ